MRKVVVNVFSIGYSLIGYFASSHISTKVPTFFPSTTFFNSPPLSILKTMIGNLFSLHSVKAVISITFNPFSYTSEKVIVSYFVAVGFFLDLLYKFHPHAFLLKLHWLQFLLHAMQPLYQS